MGWGSSAHREEREGMQVPAYGGGAFAEIRDGIKGLASCSQIRKAEMGLEGKLGSSTHRSRFDGEPLSWEGGVKIYCSTH